MMRLSHVGRGRLSDWTQQEIADVIGVSRQRVSQLTGGREHRVIRARPHVAPMVEAYVRKHPRVVRPRSQGGWTVAAIAAAVGASDDRVGRALRALGYGREARRNPPLHDAAYRRRRYQTDPIYRQRQNEYARRSRAKRKLHG
jgi:hypothetical protein